MIGIMGLGFVGLTTALGFADKGFKVYGYEIDNAKREGLKNKHIPFHEPHLGEVLQKRLGDTFTVCDSLREMLETCRVFFFCVGTPSREDGSAQLSFLMDALRETVSQFKRDDFKVVVIKSTVPPSTTQERVYPLLESLGFSVGQNIGLATNPEFLREGSAWRDFTEPDRIVIAASDARSASLLEEVYKPFGAPLCQTSFNTAEFIKYLSNSFLATLISYANELSMIAHTVGGIDIVKAFKVLHQDRRWMGSPAQIVSYLYPGCGFGGACLPKDTRALCALAAEKGYRPKILHEVMAVNQDIKVHLVQRFSQQVGREECIGILGLAFKPASDDVRESPAKDFIRLLLDKNYKNIVAYDPMAMPHFGRAFRLPIRYATDMADLALQADHIIILAGWEEFRQKKAVFAEKGVWDFRYFL